MKITIVYGFFLPVPPVAGGATEKSWHALAAEFARRGHEVTAISRSWPGLPDTETAGGVLYLRLPGFSAHASLWCNLLRDFIWSWRAFRLLPKADVVICHAVCLPLWLGRFRPEAGRVVVMAGRVPKGQYRLYGRLARVLAPSAFVRDRVLAEKRALAPLVRVTGYPLDLRLYSAPDREARAPSDDSNRPITIGYVGRIHREKGLGLFADALARLNQDQSLPPWRALICGPSEVVHGGSGEDYRRVIESRLALSGLGSRVEFRGPQFDGPSLAAVYRGIDIFCYPSIAERGETFGVAVAEAMAAGAVPVVSSLRCFNDLIRPQVNGLRFDHAAPDASAQLARAIGQLLREPGLRRQLAERARQDVQSYDYPVFAEALLADLARLCGD